MPNFTIQTNSSNQVVSIAAASRADYLAMVNDYANGADYQDQYDMESFFEALLDASENWLDFAECEDLFMSLGLA